ncbi:MAG: UDP-glucose/GDP-mannose dehydrogenase family protein [Bermanella sp.]
MNITIFGTGYVGLVQAAILAEVGHSVLCVDIDEAKINKLKQGVIDIYEPGLKAIVKSCYANGSLNFSSDAQLGVAHGSVQFIAVGTPADEDGAADIQYVLKVAHTIAVHMDDYKVVVNKSTVPVGTAQQASKIIRAELRARAQELPFDVVSNPEFLKEGAAIKDCQKPDRIIIGSQSLRAETLLREVYAPFNRNHEKIMMMDVRSAELTKYAANCMLATKISFINEMSNLAEKLGADIEHVRRGIGADERIGYQFIYAGCGYGGSCFPKDVQALVHTAQTVDYDSKLLKAVESVNRQQKQTLFKKLASVLGALTDKTIAIWGLSFKPETNDMREASSRVLMEALWAAGAKVKAYDPQANEEARRLYGQRDDLRLLNSKYDAIKGADALVIVTEWKEFKAPDFAELKKQLLTPLIIDGRNLYSPALMEELAIAYYGVGRGKSIHKVED